MTTISLVVPVFNEEDTIPLFYEAVKNYDALKKYELEIIFINDGSKDSTEKIINSLSIADKNIKAISFTRNFGKEAALFAGLEKSVGDVVIPIDVDLQHPIEVIPRLVEKWQEGADVVLAKSTERLTDGYLKRKTTSWFYKFHNKISNPKIEENAGDFRLMSRETVENIINLPERNLFMKGIFAWVGGKTEIIEYTQASRSAGKSKFNGWRLWNLALEGITSFSTLPLRVWTYIGLGVSAFSFIYAAWMVVDKLIWGNPVPGYPSLMTAILFLGGVQLIGIGILGEYIGRIYIETKRRPKFLIKKGKEKKNEF
ncbi:MULTISPECIES: glycosyltransferase family 2 protein [Citrobacter]|uniref:glycosyltransferase family 2 protein n=1 Tax=Citrobacter TaxID=544 RepID=UPI001646BAD1|nr:MULTISPECIES: glycosyltransferase family 2 protein [Citrobacter]MBJ8795528.1 glycosyltransferase family 2 protein [Citrobacter freundii]MCS0534768.1 glycosyltransferase family 2 protein [Citrobacter portucalensis]MDM2885389.1 glycosyltransferase family 2 protein [Citrobacter sp. Cpo045]MDM2913943.1 glycosyltransferase family 2 protein [Citrobacter sp. Cpo035]